jgi:hypothetical protein
MMGEDLRPYGQGWRRGSAWRAVLCVIMMLLAASEAMAHKWYPHECCHDEDCGVVTELMVLPDGSMKIRTEAGFGVVPRGFDIRPSLDSQAHACLRQNGPDVEHLGWVIVCLFLPGTV